MKIRIAETTWVSFRDQLLARGDIESAGLLFGEFLPTSAGGVIAIREAHVVPDAAYRIRACDQISIDPVALNRLTRRARDRGWSVFTVHTHPRASKPWFSKADDIGDSRWMPFMQRQIPGVPHGSMVLVEDGQTVARTFDQFGTCTAVPLHIIGRTLNVCPTSVEAADAWFDRQELALGALGQRRLRGLRVGVVGLGGIGSLVALQLAHLGIGELVLLDGDKVEASNLSRIAGAIKDDVDQTYKVDVAVRYANTLGLIRRVEAVSEFAGPPHEALLASCDVIFSCVDRQTPRAMLNRLAYKSLTPVIDLGTVFRVDATGTISGDAGRVVVIGPDRPCLACWGHIDPHALRTEALPKAEREQEIHAGYIQGATVAQPSVIAFNSYVAGAGVVELLRLATAFAGSESPPQRLAFSFSNGTVRRNTLANVHECGICGHQSDVMSACVANDGTP
jgi:hypothetical protein